MSDPCGFNSSFLSGTKGCTCRFNGCHPRLVSGFNRIAGDFYGFFPFSYSRNQVKAWTARLLDRSSVGSENLPPPDLVWFLFREVYPRGHICPIRCLMGLRCVYGSGRICLPTAAKKLPSQNIHLIHCFLSDDSSAVLYLISSGFFTATLRRTGAMLCLLPSPHIGILHPLTGDGATVQYFYRAGYHIPSFDFSHQNLPDLWQIRPHLDGW